MNPLFHWVIGLTAARTLARTCPFCGRVQIVAAGKKHEAVSCRRCGGRVPPKSPK